MLGKLVYSPPQVQRSRWCCLPLVSLTLKYIELRKDKLSLANAHCDAGGTGLTAEITHLSNLIPLSVALKPCVLNMPAGSPLGSNHPTNKTTPGLHSNSWLALSTLLFSSTSPLVLPLLSSTFPPLSFSPPSHCCSFTPSYPKCLISFLPSVLLLSSASPLPSSLQPIISFRSRLCPLLYSPATLLITSKTIKITCLQKSALTPATRTSFFVSSELKNNKKMEVMMVKVSLKRNLLSHSALWGSTVTGSQVCVNMWTEQHLLYPSTPLC